jgi:hypothetical protein
VNQISVADYCICGDETLFRRAVRTKIHGVTPKVRQSHLTDTRPVVQVLDCLCREQWAFDSIANLKLEDPFAYSLQSTGAAEEPKDGDADVVSAEETEGADAGVAEDEGANVTSADEAEDAKVEGGDVVSAEAAEEPKGEADMASLEEAKKEEAVVRPSEEAKDGDAKER